MLTRKDLLVIKDMYEEKIKELVEENKKLKYELHIARTSVIMLKHSIEGGYD